MNIKFENRRKFHRINFDGQVNLDFMGVRYDHCQINNLCLSGMFVTGDFPKQQDENCFINFSHKAKSEEIYLQASAKIVWDNEEGVGLQFTSMKFDRYMLLLTTLINNAEQPSIILHEFPKSSPFEITSL